MNTTANQINARLIAARCCDAIDPCDTCLAGRAQYRAEKRREEREGVKVPTPRTGSLRERLAAVAS